MKRALLLLITISICVCAGASQETGAVRGMVVGENNQPVTQAKVHLAETKPFVGHRILNMVETNAEGEFTISNVAWGEYVVLAGKEEAGYPDTKLAFYSNLAVPKVIASPTNAAPYVKVPLGPKAGTLQMTSLTNAETESVVRSASLTLRRGDDQRFFITVGINDGAAVLIPSGTDILIEVSARGFKTWTSEEKVRVGPEQIHRIAVHLQPEAR
jgi:hypothetical protein